MVNDKDFSKETLVEYNELVKNKVTALELLIENYLRDGDSNIDATKVVARLQTEFFALDRNESSIKPVDAWEQDDINIPECVNTALPEVVPGKYSSFALIKNTDSCELEFPLDDDYSSAIGPFELNDIPDITLLTHYKKLEDKLGVSVEQDYVGTKSKYKRNFVKQAIIKIKNTALFLTNKTLNFKGIFKGKISLRAKYESYTLSNIEKLAKAYDMVLKVSVANHAKNYKNNKYDIKITKDIKFAARIFAEILMSRVYDLKNIKNNKTLEKCLWLQFANTLNKYNFNAEQLYIITSLGTDATEEVCKTLGLTKENIMERMLKLGYTYEYIPENIKSALVEAKQKDFSMYSVATPEKATEPLTSVHGLDLGIAKGGDKVPVTETSDETKEVTAISDKTTEVEETTTAIEKAEMPPQIKEQSVDKVVDSLVIKYLATHGTALAEKVNSGKFKGKKLEVANAELKLFNLILSYYVQAVNARAMSVKNDGTYNENDISKAKFITKQILQKRAEFSKVIASADLERPEGQKSSAFVNAVCKKLYKKSTRACFAEYINGGIEYCLKNDFVKSDMPDDEEVESLLEESAKTLDETDSEMGKTDYVPNFTIVDEGAPAKSELKPNFIIIDENADSKQK